MPTGRTLDQKKSDWSLVFEFVESNLNPPLFQQLLDQAMTARAEDGQPLPTAIAMARLMAANARTAAMTAALITQNGIKPVSLDANDE